MKRIYVNLLIQNGHRQISVRALVDTGSDFLVLPISLKNDLGPFPYEEEQSVVLADGTKTVMTRCVPTVVTIEGFRPVGTEVYFGSGPDILLGHWPLQLSRAIVDEVEHRIVPDPAPLLCVGCRAVWIGKP